MKKFLLLILVCCNFNLFAQTFTNITGGAIPDNNTVVDFTVVASGLPTAINNTFGLSLVCLDVTHTYDSDLKLIIESPTGTQVVLVLSNGGSGDNFTSTCFAMNGAAGPITNGVAPFTGTYIPFGTFDLINNGQNPNGTWKISALDQVPADMGTLNNFSITFAANPPQGPGSGGGSACSTTNGASCFCPDGTQDCDLLPDMTSSALIIQQQHTETPGQITLSNATPNIGWGPMEIHGTDTCFCGTTQVPCSTTVCPNGDLVKEKVVQTYYHKNGSTITSTTRSAGYMSYHPTHGHIHVDHWASFTLRKDNGNPNPTTWPIYGVGNKVSFCLINLGDCTADVGYCTDSTGTTITMANIPNSGFGAVTGCGRDQGIYVGNLDVYSQGLDGQFIDITGVCNGDYYIVSITDPDNIFLEQNENNNWAAVPITLTQQPGGPSVNPNIQTNVVGASVVCSADTAGAVHFEWNFGDGSVVDSTNNLTTHQYAANGTYVVTYTVTSMCTTVVTTDTIAIVSAGVADYSNTQYGINAYPNPFSNNLTLSYFVFDKGNVEVEVMDLSGRRIALLVSENQASGKYNVNWNNANVAAGTYLVRFKSSNKVQTIKVVKN